MSVKITDLGPIVLPLTGTEQLEIVDSNGLTKRISSADLANPAGLQATFITVTPNPDLPNERILTAGAGISIVDGGAGLPITISATGVGLVASVNSGVNITVDNTDPINPIINMDAAILGVSVNGVTLSNAGAATSYLDETGAYSVPPVGAATLASLTDVDLTGQIQGDLLFNVDGANWEDTGGNIIFDLPGMALQFAAGFGINMGAVPVTVLEVAASGSPSVTVEHPSVQVVGEISTVSNVEVPVTGGTLPLLNDGETYLLIAIGQHHQGNTGGENVPLATLNIASASGVPFGGMRDEIEPPACVVGANQGAWFGGMNIINYTIAAHGAIMMEHAAGAGQTHYVNNANLMAINLTQFGVENTDWFRNQSVPFVTVTDAGWSNAAGSITIGDGVSDWIIFWCVQSDVPSAAAQIEYGLFDGSVNTQYASHEFEDVSDVKAVMGSIVLAGIPSTTFQVAMRGAAGTGSTARFFQANICAMRLDQFGQHEIVSLSGPTSPPGAAEFSLLTDNAVALGTSDWGVLGTVSNQWIANTISGTPFIQAQVNGGGFSTVSGFETPNPQTVVENATFDDTPKLMIPVADITGIVATDSIDTEFRWIPPATFGPARANDYGMVIFTWDTLDSSVNETTVGDPTVDTRIDGQAINFFNEYSFPLLDGAVGEGLVTDGLGQLSFAAVSIPDPLIIGSINLTSALVPSAAAPYTNVPINIGANLVGTMPMTQIARQIIQTRPSGFGFNATLFINTSGGNVQIGNINQASVEVVAGTRVNLRHAAAATIVAQTAAAAAGGLLANNLATGAGLERVLTTADLGGGGAQISGVPVNNQIAVWVNGTDIEGLSTLTFDGVALIVDGGIRGDIDPTSLGLFLTNNGAGTEIFALAATGAGGIDFDFTNVTVVNFNSGGIYDFSNEILRSVSTLYLQERAAAQVNIVGQGKLWMLNTSPNQLYFTDDAAEDFAVAYAKGRVLFNSTHDFNTAGNYAANWIGYYVDGTSNTITVEASASQVNWPVGMSIQVIAPGSGVQTIAEGVGTTISFDDGVDSVGGYTLSQGVNTIFRASATSYIAWGSGITP